MHNEKLQNLSFFPLFLEKTSFFRTLFLEITVHETLHWASALRFPIEH